MDRYGYVSNNHHPHSVPITSQYHHKTTHMPASQTAPYNYNVYTGGPGGAVQPPVIGQQQEPIMRQPEYHRREMRAEMFTHEGRPWTTGILGCMEDCDSCMSSLYIVSFFQWCSGEGCGGKPSSHFFQGCTGEGCGGVKPSPDFFPGTECFTGIPLLYIRP